MKPKFGQLIEIGRDQYLKEVNEAPKGIIIIARCICCASFILKLYGKVQFIKSTFRSNF